jgi:hypothetical protein
MDVYSKEPTSLAVPESPFDFRIQLKTETGCSGSQARVRYRSGDKAGEHIFSGYELI